MFKRNKVAKIIEDMNKQLSHAPESRTARLALGEFSLFKLAGFNQNAAKVTIKRKLSYLKGLISGAADPNKDAQAAVTARLDALKTAVEAAYKDPDIGYDEAIGLAKGMVQEEFLEGSWTAWGEGEADVGDVIEDEHIPDFKKNMEEIINLLNELAQHEGDVAASIDTDALVDRATVLFTKAFDWFRGAPANKKDQLKKMPEWIAFDAFRSEVQSKKLSDPPRLKAAADAFEAAFPALQ
jgi:hypothetical protein